MWGKEHEEVATQDYEVFIADHSDLSVRTSGLQLSIDEPFLAISPDRLVSCSCCGDGILEVKCPYQFRDTAVVDMVKCRDSCLDADFLLKKGHPFYSQVQLQLYVTKLQYADFMVWTTVDSHVCRVYPDSQWFSDTPPLLGEFWRNHVVPALTTSKVPEEYNSDESVVHCVCGAVDSGQMVGCDNDKCSYQWFHWKCVGLSKAPRSKTWYCPDCRPK